MLNCKSLTRLVSDAFHRRLTFGERMNLLMHIAMCGTCRKFRSLQQRIQAVIVQRTSKAEVPLPDESKGRLREVVHSAMSDGTDQQN